jgi:hypothetical protein
MTPESYRAATKMPNGPVTDLSDHAAAGFDRMVLTESMDCKVFGFYVDFVGLWVRLAILKFAADPIWICSPNYNTATL